MIQKIKGTMDLLPDVTPLYRYIEGVMREEAGKYGFGEIRTPMFENTELFVRGVGDTTDVVQKEMYTFHDRDDDRSITLRPEGTAGTLRSCIEHGLMELAQTSCLGFFVAIAGCEIAHL